MVTDVEGLPVRDDAIMRVEFLSESRSGVGTRFRETRTSGRRETTTELEITELVANEHARFVSDAGGTIWDTTFRTRAMGTPAGSKTEFQIDMEARPHKLLARIFTPLIRPMVRKGMQSHIDAFRAHCEGR